MGDLKDAAHNLTGQPEISDQDFRATLDPVYFKQHKDFKTAFAAAAKDDDEEKCDPFNKEDQEFAKLCFKHGLATGTGLHDWVRAVYHIARDALSREIKDQTQSVRRGDVFGLLRAIQLSVNQLELFDPTQLDAAFTKCTMDGEGNSDLMTYLSALKRYIDRQHDRRASAALRRPRPARRQAGPQGQPSSHAVLALHIRAAQPWQTIPCHQP